MTTLLLCTTIVSCLNHFYLSCSDPPKMLLHLHQILQKCIAFEGSTHVMLIFEESEQHKFQLLPTSTKGTLTKESYRHRQQYHSKDGSYLLQSSV